MLTVFIIMARGTAVVVVTARITGVGPTREISRLLLFFASGGFTECIEGIEDVYGWTAAAAILVTILGFLVVK
jgi:hypothetical protein